MIFPRAAQALLNKLWRQVRFLIAHDAQGPQRKLRALLFVVLVIGLSRSLRDHGIKTGVRVDFPAHR